MKARIPKNFGGMPNNMQSMIQQAQKMQEDITKKQAEIDEMEFTASVGGGAVEVVMSGKKELKAITIKPEVVDPEDVEMLQDLVISAVNEALRNVEAKTAEEMDKVTGLMLGADDYVTKPFSPSELVARVDSLYRRVAIAEMREENNFQEELVSGDFVLNLRNRALKKKGRMIELTQVEFQIMEYFISNAGKALKRSEILKHVWGSGYVGEEKIVDVNIRRLRMKIEDEPSNPRHVVTVWGIGYRWDK